MSSIGKIGEIGRFQVPAASGTASRHQVPAALMFTMANVCARELLSGVTGNNEERSSKVDGGTQLWAC
jgi:hypothetical protein